MLLMFSSKDNQNRKLDCRCPVCAERHRVTRHGCYWRCAFDSDRDRIAVQRFRCGNPDCPRKTFSIPPPGLLPYYRTPLWVMLWIYRHSLADTAVNQCAKHLKIGWNSAKRALDQIKRTLDLVRDELRIGSLPPTPYDPSAWQQLARLFSSAFFPGRP